MTRPRITGECSSKIDRSRVLVTSRRGLKAVELRASPIHIRDEYLEGEGDLPEGQRVGPDIGPFDVLTGLDSVRARDTERVRRAQRHLHTFDDGARMTRHRGRFEKVAKAPERVMVQRRTPPRRTRRPHPSRS